MLLVRDGDLQRLGVLFERYSAKLLGFFVRHTSKRDASEDLVQEVFLRILKYRHTFRGEAPFSVWMYRLAHNVSSDYYRKWRREVPADESIAETPDDDPTAEESLVRNEEHALLSRALDRLSEDKREVLILSRYQELKYEEIARVLECPVGTVKARVHFALKDLRAEYGKLTTSREEKG